MFSLRRWRARHLLLAWCGYWLALAAVTLGPGVAALLEATSGESGGSAGAHFGNAGVTLNVALHGVTTWSASASLLSIALWLVGPPIALWVAWMARRPSRGAAGLPGGSQDAPLLRDAPPEQSAHARSRERVERPR